MANLTNDYDAEYSIKSASSDVFYKKDNDKVVNKPSLILKITRKTSLTVKSLKWLRKNGFLNNWNYFRILLNKKEELFPILSGILLAFISLISLGSVSYCLYRAAQDSISVLALILITLVNISVLVAQFAYFSNYSETLFKNKLPKEFKEKTHQIIIDQDNESLYGLIKNINQYKFTHAEKQDLFNIIEKYPYEVNEKIHKLVQLKEKLPTDAKEANDSSYSIFQDTDKMLDELFAVRDSQENKAMLKKVESILNSSVERQNLEKLGVSVEELSEVSEFLEKIKKTSNNTSKPIVSLQQNPDVSEVVGSLNNAADKEAAEEVPVQKAQWNAATVS